MHFLNDIGLSVRLYLGYGLVLVLMLVLVFIGVRDVSLINGNLTEINVTSPTGIQELERFDGVNIAEKIWQAIEARHAAR